MSDVLRTPDAWMRIKHPDKAIYDPDGWRGPNGRSFDDPITEAEFDRRYIQCTIGPKRDKELGYALGSATDSNDRGYR